MPASGHRLTKVKRPNLVRFWSAVLPDCGVSLLLLLPQLAVMFTGVGYEMTAMAECSASCSPGIPCTAAGCTLLSAQGTFASWTLLIGS